MKLKDKLDELEQDAKTLVGISVNLSSFMLRIEIADMAAKAKKLIAIVRLYDEALELALSFCPKGPVPIGLDPTFYHTLEYDSEVKLQERIDLARKARSEAEKILNDPA